MSKTEETIREYKSRDAPIAEVTLRKYEKPFRLEGRALVKKFCLSVGLLQPGDSRDVIVDVLFSLLKAKKPLTSQALEHEIKKTRSEHALKSSGTASSNIRRQVRRLKELFLVERIGNAYRIAENASLHELFSEKIEKFYLPAIVLRVKEYCEALEKERCKYG